MSTEPAQPDSTAPRDPYRELFERSADAILIIEGDKFISCNDAAVEMLRYGSREEVLQTHPSELSPPSQPDGRDSFEKANEYMAIAFSRGSHRFEWDHRRADGEIFPVEVLLTAVQEPGRETLHVVWRDITERKMLEDQLRQALKMEAIGKLTGGIAHDFNNLLVAVLGHANLLGEAVQSDPEAAGHVREIVHAGERAADLVRQLLAFGRKQQLLPAVLDLNQLTLDTTQLLSRLVGESVRLATKLAPDPIPVKVDRSQLEQVLLNLAANARDAMPGGGRLTIETSRMKLSSADAAREQGLSPGEYALLSFADTGSGMDSEVANRAFDPFFTTKTCGQGSGLGLATVYGIVRQSGGSVSLSSLPGYGTTVDLLLPLTSEPIALPAERRTQGESSERGGETLLVVEDEPAVSKLVVQALTGRGYRVLECRDGREALRLFTRHRNEVALILTDVIMPNLGGPELVIELAAQGYTPRVLFLSGYTDQGISVLHELEGEVDLLPKPFDVPELLRRVRAALDRERPAR